MKFQTLVVLASSVFLLGTACAMKPLAKEADRAPIPAGPLMADSIRFQYAIYYLPTPSKDPLVELKPLLAETKNAPTLVDELPETPWNPVISVTSLEEVQ